MVVAGLLVGQTIALAVLIARLFPGRRRRPPVEPLDQEIDDTTVSVIVATLNEAHRIEPCLRGLVAQRRPLHEILIVDSRSTDGTRELVERWARDDDRIRLLTDNPLPAGWVGKVWALEHGLRNASGDWILGVDADTSPEPGMVAGIIAAAREGDWSVASFSPRFADQTAAEQFIQPAMLLTLVYRGGVAGGETDADHVMANGQCFLARREALVKHGGYAPARGSFADDVTLARHLARRGERVGFLDGSRLYSVRSYQSAREMWREWGRSLDLKNATTTARQWIDLAFLTAIQALPILVVLVVGCVSMSRALTSVERALLVVDAVALSIRISLLLPLSRSYDRTTPFFWLSPFADPLAVFRIVQSTMTSQRTWRGRRYDGGANPRSIE